MFIEKRREEKRREEKRSDIPETFKPWYSPKEYRGFHAFLVGDEIMNKVYILCDDPTRFGGIQQFVRNLSEFIPAEQVTLLALYGDQKLEKQVDRSIYLLNDRQKRNWFERAIGSFTNSYNTNNPWKRKIAILQDIPFIRRRLKELLHSGGNTVIINAFCHVTMYFTPEILKKNKIIVVQHTEPNRMKSSSYYFGGITKSRKLSWFKKYVDSMVFLSPFEEKMCSYLSLTGKITTCIRHSINLPDAPMCQGVNHAFVLSRLVKIKRINLVIQVAKAMPHVTFHICGDGPERAELEKLALGCTNVIFHGYINNVKEILDTCGVLLITSTHEGYPLSGIEATAHGKPIIALNTFCAAQDLVVEGKNGHLLPAEFDLNQFKDGLQEIFQNFEHYYNGAMVLRNRFDKNIIKTQWLNLLKQVEEKEKI